MPSVVFWAWERPEDFRFLDTHTAGVAFLAKTIDLTARPVSGKTSSVAFTVRPRLQPLRLAPGSQLIAVVRIEAATPPRREYASLHLTGLSSEGAAQAALRESLATEIAGLQAIPGIRAIQIDFDATAGEQAFYGALLEDVRRKLPATLPLSITALASWCIGDPWLTQLPPGTIQEAVPMLFRMGPASADVVRFLRSGTDFPVAACRNSLGLSTDEPLSQILLSGKLAGFSTPLQSKRIYVFAPRPWTPAAAQNVLEELQP